MIKEKQLYGKLFSHNSCTKLHNPKLCALVKENK